MSRKNHTLVEHALRRRFSFFSSPHKRMLKLLKTKLDSLSEADVMFVLQKMNCTNPKWRKLDIYDEYFSYLVPIMHKFDEVLWFLNRYGFVCDTYVRSLQEPEKNLDLQRRLCQVYIPEYFKDYRLKYSNILCRYLRNYNLAPELEEELAKDDKYLNVISVCQMFGK